jgi:hypothetical protein
VCESWTAVVRGAVIHGIEKLDIKNLTVMESCPRSYGIILRQTYSATRHNHRSYYIDAFTDNKTMANGQLVWLIQKGDLLLSNEQKEAEQMFAFTFRETESRKLRLCVYEYSDEDLPSQFQNSREGK